MQIQNIILYRDEERKRVLRFELGKVNIITGESKSGKTAILNIIDYCLGSKDCKIAAGVIRDNVKWFAITISFDNDESYVIARANPDMEHKKIINDIYLERVDKKFIPSFEDLQANSKIDILKGFLSKKIGIAENLQVPETGTRKSLEASFRHARLFCFQPQTVVAAQDFLFYKQSETFISQGIKDVLPYFLGAIREDALRVEQEINNEKKKLRILLREKREAGEVSLEGEDKAKSLLEEAKRFGILESDLEIKENSNVFSILESIKDWEYNPAKVSINGEGSILKKLVNKRQEMKLGLANNEDTIAAAKTFMKSNFNYAKEVEQQKVRLESINLFKKRAEGYDECPLCHNKLDATIPAIDAIQTSLSKLNASLQETVSEKPHLERYLANLQKEKEDIKGKILEIEKSIAALYEEKEQARRLRDLNLRRGKVLGRISLFLESVSFTEDITVDNKIEVLRSKIKELSKMIDKESKEEKLAVIFNKMNFNMTRWIDDLDDFEYKDAFIRFDLSKLTLFADVDDKSIPLSEMGSGANWLICHLLIHFALHSIFIKDNRPVPRFLIIDQPTQVYFPPEKKPHLNSEGEFEDNSDRVAVKKMFDFIIDRTNEMNSKFQVIITEHAHLNEDKFNHCVREVWRDGKKLIPEDWYE